MLKHYLLSDAIAVTITLKHSKCYSELVELQTFAERFEYLQLNGYVGDLTFGGNRYLNQMLYTSDEWKAFRDEIIIRDNGCDLAVPGREIYLKKSIIVHHLNPITVQDVINRRSCVFDPENVVCTILKTHNGIHYGDLNSVANDFVERRPNDTSPWRR